MDRSYENSGGAGVISVELLIGNRGEHAEAAVPPGPVVEHLYPVEDLRRQLGARPPPPRVEQFGLHSRPE